MYACQLLHQVTQTTPACVQATTPDYPDHSCVHASYYTRLLRPAWDPKSGNSAAHNGYVFPYKDNLLKTYHMSQPDLQKTSLILSSQMTHYCVKLTTELTVISNF